MSLTARVIRSCGGVGPKFGPVQAVTALGDLPPESGVAPLVTLRLSTEVIRPPARIAGGPIPAVFDTASRAEHPDFVLAYLSEGRILTGDGWLFTRDGRLILESLADPSFVTKRQLDSRWLWPRVTESVEACLLAYPHWARDNYYHFLLEFIPRLTLALSELERSDGDSHTRFRVLLPSEPTAWMWELLELAGVPRDRCLVTDGRQLRVGQVLFASRLGQPMSTPLWAIEWLRRLFIPGYGAGPTKPCKRLYLSRRKASKRRVVNEEEVEKVLQMFGFQTVMLEDFTVAQQVELFGQAEAVVGPHGAGFANIVFADRAKVLEFLDSSWVWPTYYALGHDCGHEYCGLLCRTVDGGNMEVDVQVLRATVSQLVNPGSQSKGT